MRSAVAVGAGIVVAGSVLVYTGVGRRGVLVLIGVELGDMGGVGPDVDVGGASRVLVGPGLRAVDETTITTGVGLFDAVTATTSATPIARATPPNIQSQRIDAGLAPGGRGEGDSGSSAGENNACDNSATL